MEQDSSTPAPDRGTQLAQTRTYLALERTVIAAERTLMAWIRTALSMIGFGFTIYKFLQYLREAGNVSNAMRPYAPRNFGMALILLGILSLIAAIWQYRQFIARVGAAGPRNMWSLSVIVAILVVLIGILAFLGTLLHRGPF